MTYYGLLLTCSRRMYTSRHVGEVHRLRASGASLMSTFRTFLAVAILKIAAGALAACNTIGGAGEDIAAGGKAISKTADKASDAL